VIYLIRHGETAWSATRRHTGRTDVPLTERGREQAAALAPVLAGLRPARVLTSPLSRARDTCELAGFGSTAEVDERLLEWDYGEAEGRTTAEIRTTDPAWSVWTHPIGGAETLASVSDRVDAVIAELTEPDPVTVIFAHAHLLRVLAARWCRQPADFGKHLELDPASISRLGFERETPTIERWNAGPEALG
jgi:broad specificity phosphatase PhoE